MATSDLLHTEHAAGVHARLVGKLSTCPECYPDSAERPRATTVEMPSDHGLDAAVQHAIAVRGRPMQSLGEAIEEVRKRLRAKGVVFPGPLREGETLDPPPLDDGPMCDTCKGHRWVRHDAPYGDPLFGSLIVCRECDRGFLRQQRVDRMYGELPRLFAGWTFRTLPAAHPGLRAIAKLAREWLAAPPLPYPPPAEVYPWLYLWGPSGTGKTGIAVALMHEATTTRSLVCKLKVTGDLLDMIRDTWANREAYDSAAQSAKRVLERLNEVDLLVLDDFGSEYHKRQDDWAATKLFQIIGYRHDHGLRTIFTSNYSLDEMRQTLGHPRTTARIDELCVDRWVLNLTGLPDMR